MSILEELHEAHKARQARIAAAAYKSIPIVDHTPKAEPIEVIEPPEPCRIRSNRSLAFWRQVATSPSNVDVYPSIGLIQAIITRRYGITHRELLSVRRFAAATRVRQIGMHLARNHTMRSMPEIARMFGRRDHTTVLHAHNKFETLRRRDPAIEAELSDLDQKLYEQMKSAPVSQSLKQETSGAHLVVAPNETGAEP